MELTTFNNLSVHSKPMKMSFSCSSLQRSSDSLESPDHAKIRIDRPYSSLTKKRKDPNQETCQRTWINRDDCKDDFWAAIRSNYDYIMDTNLIDSCKEANGELIWDEGDVSTLSWGLKEVSCQFSELYTWLGVLQELVYSKEENLLDKSLRAAHMEDLKRKAYRRRLFNDQAAKLVARTPSLKDEVAWRVDHLNAKWELVEQIMAPTQPASNQQDVSADFEHEVKCLRKWLREMESRLQPLSFRVNWTIPELEEKAKEHMVLQKDIEAHGRIVNSIVKLSERVAKQHKLSSLSSSNQEDQSIRQVQAIRVARTLERRWHLLFLRALEWQCHIETLATRIRNKSIVPCRCSSDSDEEPVTKQPRLSRRQSRESGNGVGRGHIRKSSLTKRAIPSRRRNREAGVTSSCSDSDMSSGSRNNDEESYFEDDLEQFSVTESKVLIGQNIDQRSDCVEHGDQGEEGDIEEGEATDDEMPPTLDPVTTSVTDEIDGITKNTHAVSQAPLQNSKIFDEYSSYNTSDRKSKNYATFYFKHRDTDSEADVDQNQNENECENDNGGNVEESSEEEWTYTATSPVEKNSVVTMEKKRTNVVVRLDFGETTVEKINNYECTLVEEENSTLKENKNELERKEKELKQSEDCESEDDTRNNIKKLISDVEKLVSEEGRNKISKNFPELFIRNSSHQDHRAKYSRVKEWLKVNSRHESEENSPSKNWQPLDSCDASGEYTTGESDIEKQSDSSEDLQSSIATYRLGSVSHSVSQETFKESDKTSANEGNNLITPVDASTPRVIMRTKKKSNGPRPWSVSCVFGQMNSNVNADISQFSISETALHQLVTSPPTKSASLDATESNADLNNSSTTMLEESGRSVRNSSLRKKKMKLRKKTLSRKSESGSDGINGISGGSDGSSSHQNRSTRKQSDSRMRLKKLDCHRCVVSLVTHGSTIACHLHNEGIDKGYVGNPPPSIKLTCCTPDPSSGDTEENIACRKRIFMNDINRKQLISPIDSDIEKNSLGNNSFSEQAWDSYQEKYMSEPYSEVADVETARKLLDFGDDYRNFLDSQSDCASSLSAVRCYSPLLLNKRVNSENKSNSSEDSDSDAENYRRVVEKSYNKLLVMENYFSCANNNSKIIQDNIDVKYICKENIKCLQMLVEPNRTIGGKNLKQVRGLTERWKNLSHKVEEIQRANALQREIAALHLEFRALGEKLISYEIAIEPAHVLENNIHQITTELATLRERKSAMLALNVSAHRLITDLGAAATSVSISLKDGVADLYRVWDETYQRGNQQLCALQSVQQFSARLSELQSALRRDKDTLAVLDAALQAGATSEVASSVRDVARLLSEKQDVNCEDQVVIKEDALTPVSGEKFLEAGVTSLGQECGTFSDSGISDSGSEQELSERERRLAALRRLTRSLENQLAPGSEALAELWRRVEDAEVELRNLQKQCRELIVRTAASVEAKVASCNSQTKHLTSKRKMRSADDAEPLRKLNQINGIATDDPEDDPNISQNWIWRILRAALPFQLAIVALFCAACLLEPHCCEASNNLNLSFTPQLRYVRGPPPI
ncbi:uncharacterized protein klar [Chelonus insularis]|uniref:uncharacterized protein klar n=1 Tax=Chelonus insularis TaxID=460826 RepID=UPI00158A6111|nr:uncharacterized protein LOC118073012 [Chelonus insularis]XP_034949179.1 uncharacterized protein LOC118073012 [Chelonus insularis]